MFLSSLVVNVVGDFGEINDGIVANVLPQNDNAAIVYLNRDKQPLSALDSLFSPKDITASHFSLTRVSLDDLRWRNISPVQSTNGQIDECQDVNIGDLVDVWLENVSLPLSFKASAHLQNEGLHNRPNNLLVNEFSWWKCRVTKVASELFGVDVIFEHRSNKNNSDEYNATSVPMLKRSEIVERNQLRPHTELLKITYEGLQRHSLSVPYNYSISINLDDVSMRDFVHRLQGPVLVVPELLSNVVLGSGDPHTTGTDCSNQNQQITFISTDFTVIRRVKLLEESLKRLLNHKCFQINTQTRNQTQDFYSQVFSVEAALIGMSIGQQGRNITEARQIPGVTSIYLDNSTKTFYIYGTSKSAVKSARDRLEYMRDIIQVPDEYTMRIIGKNGVQLQEVVDKSQVFRAYVHGSLNEMGTGFVFPNGVVADRVPDHTPFQFEGRRSQLEDARLLIEFNIDVLRQIDSNFTASMSGGIASTLSSCDSLSQQPHRAASLPLGSPTIQQHPQQQFNVMNPSAGSMSNGQRYNRNSAATANGGPPRNMGYRNGGGAGDGFHSHQMSSSYSEHHTERGGADDLMSDHHQHHQQQQLRSSRRGGGGGGYRGGAGGSDSENYSNSRRLPPTHQQQQQQRKSGQGDGYKHRQQHPQHQQPVPNDSGKRGGGQNNSSSHTSANMAHNAAPQAESSAVAPATKSSSSDGNVDATANQAAPATAAPNKSNVRQQNRGGGAATGPANTNQQRRQANSNSDKRPPINESKNNNSADHPNTPSSNTDAAMEGKSSSKSEPNASAMMPAAAINAGATDDAARVEQELRANDWQ